MLKGRYHWAKFIQQNRRSKGAGGLAPTTFWKKYPFKWRRTPSVTHYPISAVAHVLPSFAPPPTQYCCYGSDNSISIICTTGGSHFVVGDGDLGLSRFVPCAAAPMDERPLPAYCQHPSSTNIYVFTMTTPTAMATICYVDSTLSPCVKRLNVTTSVFRMNNVK